MERGRAEHPVELEPAVPSGSGSQRAADPAVTFRRLEPSYADVALPAAFLGVALLAALFVLVVLVAWIRAHAAASRGRTPRDKSPASVPSALDVPTRTPRPEEDDSRCPDERDAADDLIPADDFAFRLPRIFDDPADLKFEDEAEDRERNARRPPAAHMRKSKAGKTTPPGGEGSRLALVDSSLPPRSEPAPPERRWIPRGKTLLDWRGRGQSGVLAVPGEAPRSPLVAPTLAPDRSPSLEKDDRSPLFRRDEPKNARFRFGEDAAERCAAAGYGSGGASPLVEVRVQPPSTDSHRALELVSRRSGTPESPCESFKVSSARLRRAGSLNGEARTPETVDFKGEFKRSPKDKRLSRTVSGMHFETFDGGLGPESLERIERDPGERERGIRNPSRGREPVRERAEVQNSPRATEDVDRGPRFDFSPGLFRSGPLSSAGSPGDRKSPSFFADNQSRNASPKSFRAEGPLSPRISAMDPYRAARSPLIMDNGMDHFRFDKAEYGTADNRMNDSPDEVDCAFLTKGSDDTDVSAVELAGNEKTDLEKLSPQPSIGANVSRNGENEGIDFDRHVVSRGNSLKVDDSREESIKTRSRRNSGRPALSRDNSFNVAVDDPSQDRKMSGDRSATFRNGPEDIANGELSMRMSLEMEDNEPAECIDGSLQINIETDDSDRSANGVLPAVTEDGPDGLSVPQAGGTANYRRQRLKSISLDSDNAKFIEQNLGIPIVKHLRHENLFDPRDDGDDSEAEPYDDDGDTRFHHADVPRRTASPTHRDAYFKFGVADAVDLYAEFRDGALASPGDALPLRDGPVDSPEPASPVKYLRDGASAVSFCEMQPRFSPKEFDSFGTGDVKMSKVSKNIRNLTIDIGKRDEDLERELREYERLDSATEKRATPKTPTLKVKAASLDSSETLNLSLPRGDTLRVPHDSVSVPNTPKRRPERPLGHRAGRLVKADDYGGNLRDTHGPQRKLHSNAKGPAGLKDSGIFLRENHASLMLFQAAKYVPGSAFSRRMGSFDENTVDPADNGPTHPRLPDLADHRLGPPQKHGDGNPSVLKQNLSVSSANLKTLPEGVPSSDFRTRPDMDRPSKRTLLQRRGSNQSLTINLDGAGAGLRRSTLSLRGSDLSLASFGASGCNLNGIKGSASNFSLNTDNRQRRNILERRNSNTSLTLAPEPARHARPYGGSSCSLRASQGSLAGGRLLQRRGSNASLTLNLQGSPACRASASSLARCTSNGSLDTRPGADTDAVGGRRRGLLERRGSNASLTLNVDSGGTRLRSDAVLSVSNYDLDGSGRTLSRCGSGLGRRGSDVSEPDDTARDVPRDVEIDEAVARDSLAGDAARRTDRHRKAVSTESLLPEPRRTRTSRRRDATDTYSFGSHDDLRSDRYAEGTEAGGGDLAYVGGDPDDEMIYAVRPLASITTEPLSPHATSEDFKTYLANVQHLQNASNILTGRHLRDLSSVFREGYSRPSRSERPSYGTLPEPDDGESNPQRLLPEADAPRPDRQKALLRNLHQEFWDLPTNFQEKPMVFGSHPKNRYKTILPNEHSRVILRAEAGATDEGYINANYIKGHDYTKNCYIATQGPLQNTVYDFWLMVYQNGSRFNGDGCTKTNEERHFGSPRAGSGDTTERSREGPSAAQKIVMLTNLVENGRQKCERYFPLELDEELLFRRAPVSACSSARADLAPPGDSEANSFTVKNVGILNKVGYTVRKLNVVYRNRFLKVAPEYPRDSLIKIDIQPSTGGEETVDVAGDDQARSLVVYHYWFDSWADHKCPEDVTALLALSLDASPGRRPDFETREKRAEPSDAPVGFERGTEADGAAAAHGERRLSAFQLAKAFFDEASRASSESVRNVGDRKNSLAGRLDPPKLRRDSGTRRESASGIDLRKSVTIPKSIASEADREGTDAPPLIVHCSAGIGRTGCLIAVLNGLRQLEAEGRVDVLGIVCNMRLNRGGMVQNSEQYELIHKVLCLHREIAPPDAR